MRACHIVGSAHPEFDTVSAWDRVVLQSPERALDEAQRSLDQMPSEPDRILLLYAAGRAQFELGRTPAATETLRQAVVALRSAVDVPAETRTSVLMTSAIVFAEAGAVAEALAGLDVLEAECDGVALGRVFLQRGLVLLHAGHLPDSLVALDRCDRLFAAGADDRDRLRLHQNRGVVLLQQRELVAAEADFLAAADLARRLGMTATEGQCHANTGALYGRARRLYDALAAFERADALLTAAGRPDRIATWMEIDRAEVMMHFGLLDDAVAAAHRAFETALPSGNAVLTGDALLMCAQTELRAGRSRDAARTAAAARSHLAATGRPDMIDHVDAIGACADLALSDAVTAPAFDRSADVVERLRHLGWHEPADALVAERLRAAWRIGAWDAVADDIASLRLHAFGDRRDLALIGWFAEAVARAESGDAAGSVDACLAGLDFLDGIVAEAADLEARSAAVRLGADLSRWLIEVAVGLGDAELVLAASEGTRARALHDELADGERHRPLTQDGADRLVSELAARLEGRRLVQWVVAAGRVWAVVCSASDNRLIDVADLRSVVHERDRVVVWLDRAAAEPDDSSARAQRAARLLDDLLLGPLDLPDDVSVIIVPVDELHGVPWSGLTSIADRPVVISPSCRLWLDADRRASGPVRTAGFVAGPNLAEHEVERASLRTAYGRVDEATGAGAAAATVRTMLGAHDLVHVAAHGRFRAERPLLSTFELADGEVTLHDSVPERVGCRLAVLSSCEGGAHQGTGGSEVLGLAAVLLARGAASVLAPLTIVRELECGEFVAAVHREMMDGTPFGLAVAKVRSTWLRDDDLSRWAVASSFCCFGSGATRRSHD